MTDPLHRAIQESNFFDAPVTDAERESIKQSKACEQLVKSAINETRELVAALPQELFDLRKKCRELEAQLAAVREFRGHLHYPCLYGGSHVYTVDSHYVNQLDAALGKEAT